MSTAAPSFDGRRWRAPKWALALPSIVWYIAFFVIPIIFIVLYSFGTKNALSTSGVPVALTSL